MHIAVGAVYSSSAIFKYCRLRVRGREGAAWQFFCSSALIRISIIVLPVIMQAVILSFHNSVSSAILFDYSNTKC